VWGGGGREGIEKMQGAICWHARVFCVWAEYGTLTVSESSSDCERDNKRDYI